MKSKPNVQQQRSVPVLLVGEPSAELDRLESLLASQGAAITRAENVCYAEMFAEQQYFEAAVYGCSLPTTEQLSLARIMRVRWPWMKLVSCSQVEPGAADSLLFDYQTPSEAALPRYLLDALLN